MFKTLQPDFPAIEQRNIELSGKSVAYTLKRSGKRRSIGLNIDEDGLTVSVPLRVSEKWLHSVLQEKAQWIVTKLKSWEGRMPARIQWLDGQAIHFMGEQLVLRVIDSLFDVSPLVKGRQLFIHVSNSRDQELVQRAVIGWYQHEAEILLKQRVAIYAPRLNVEPAGVRLSAARAQWGSCSARGMISLNWQLIRMPLRLADYVVVHELAHMIELNHSASFWRVVRSVCPGYIKLRKELRKWTLLEA